MNDTSARKEKQILSGRVRETNHRKLNRINFSNKSSETKEKKQIRKEITIPNEICSQ